MLSADLALSAKKANKSHMILAYRLTDLLLLPNEQLARRVIALSLRTNELSNAIKLSKEHVDRIKNDNQKAIRLEKQAAQVRLKEQKTHYEGIVVRHQGFIEQVIIEYSVLI